MKRADFRKSVVDLLAPHAKEDPRIILLVCDMGFGVVDGFRKELPGRMFNTGVMEQGTVGIAAGMAMAGLVPVVYSIVNFLAYRAIEQVRNDVVLQGLNVKFIGTGANDYFKFLGRSHCCGQDDKRLMRLLGVPVYDPYAAGALPFPRMVRRWITSPRAGYLRV
jgi:transketolase